MNNIFGVTVILREDERLRNNRAARKQLRQFVFEGLHHGPDLIFSDNSAVKLIGAVSHLFVKPFPTPFAGFAIALVHVEARVNRAALRGYLRPDPIDFIGNVHTIRNGVFMPVFSDEILIEEAERLL